MIKYIKRIFCKHDWMEDKDGKLFCPMCGDEATIIDFNEALLIFLFMLTIALIASQ